LPEYLFKNLVVPGVSGVALTRIRIPHKQDGIAVPSRT
jgi:hypothetical protein